MFENELLQYGYVMVFLVAAVEGELALVAAAVLAHQGRMSYGMAIVAAFFGSVLVSEIYFFAARNRGREWLRRKAERHPKVARVESWVQRRGTLLVFWSRFLWGFRMWIPLAAAACGMRPRTFTFWNITGAVFWMIVFAPLCYFFGQAVQALYDDFQTWSGPLAVIAGVMLALVLLWKMRRRLLRAVRKPAS